MRVRPSSDPNDGLVLLTLDSFHGVDHLQSLVLNGHLFRNCVLNRRVVLLVTQLDVVEERAFRWQEPDGHFETLGVPEFRLHLIYVPLRLFFKLEYESLLS